MINLILRSIDNVLPVLAICDPSDKIIPVDEMKANYTVIECTDTYGGKHRIYLGRGSVATQNTYLLADAIREE